MPIGKLYVELTSACNLNCAICYRRAWTDGTNEMARTTFEVLSAFVRRSASLRTIVLGGIGEPTASPLFAEACSVFSGKDLVVTTNGADLDDSVLNVLADYAASVVFSVDGLRETFAEIRGTELESVIGSVKRLLTIRQEKNGARPRIEFLFVLSDRNARDLPDIADLAADLGIDALKVSHLLPQNEADAKRILYGRYAKEETRALFDRVRARAMRRGVNLSLPPIELKTERRCSFAEDDAAYIDAQGDLVPCYRFAHDGTEFVFGRKKRVIKYRFGNVEETPIEELWYSKAYVNFRSSLLTNRYPSCPDCDLADGCALVDDSGADCWSGSPSCADCLWARGFMRCS